MHFSLEHHDTRRGTAEPGPVGRGIDTHDRDPSARVSLRVEYPTSDTIVIAVCGEIDEAALSRVEHVLAPRLASMARVLVLDLTHVTFLSVSGALLLHRAARYARARGMALPVVARTHGVRRTLRVTGLQTVLDCYTRASQALASYPDNPAGPAFPRGGR